MNTIEASGGTSPPHYERGWYKKKSKQSSTKSIQLGQLVSKILDKS